MLKFNNNHIFTGYLKQLLSSFGLPACKIYTREFVDYLEKHGKEDPRILKSFDNLAFNGIDGQEAQKASVRISYLKNDVPYSYFSTSSHNLFLDKATWQQDSKVFYNPEKNIHGITRHLNSPGINYDTKTHEYLGDYLRFLRDYYNINLMSMYNCFTDKIYSNIYFSFLLNSKNRSVKISFNGQEPEYRLYALPVKLFSNYTIAIDCDQGVELFCGLYNSNLDMSNKAEDLAARTYQRVHRTIFKQPFLYDKLDVKYWSDQNDFMFDSNGNKTGIRTDVFTRWDITNRERDLRLFIKVPATCKSSITILEGDFRTFNDAIYVPEKGHWKYKNNHCVLNFDTSRKGDNIDLNNYDFTPISRLQLLAINTGESYPFADRLIEYLGGSAITPTDEIPDNIKRVQKVMNQNGYYFKIDGLWEDKMKNILYDYMINSGPAESVVVGDDIENDPDNVGKKLLDPENYPHKSKQVASDKHRGYHPRLGHNAKSQLYDVLGYVDKDVEKLYASWKVENGKAVVGTSLQNVDIYDGLYNN